MSSSPASTPLVLSDEGERYLNQIVGDFAEGISFVPWIGAGVSVVYGYPGWTRFLKDLTEGTGVKARIDAMLDLGQYEEAAEAIRDHLGHLKFEDEFSAKFAKAPVVPTGSTAMREIARMTAGLAVTTNFEKVAQTELVREFGSGLAAPIEGAMLDRARAAIDSAKPNLWMIHGTAEERTTRVLTMAEYAARYEVVADGSEIPVLTALLETLFSAKRILFVGCSLSNDRTMRIMKGWVDRFGLGSPHYAILEEPEASERDDRVRFLAERAIRPIFYPKGDHGRVQEILKRIADGVSPQVASLRRHGGRLVTLASRRALTEPPQTPVTSHHLDIADHFDVQPLRAGHTWDEVADRIAAFVSDFSADRAPLTLDLQAHLSLCALVGSHLPARRNIPVRVMQSGAIWWATDEGHDPDWSVEVKSVGPGEEWALLIEAVPGARHDVMHHLGSALPQVGTLVLVAHEKSHRVESGRHAKSLVDAAVRAVRERTRPARQQPLHVFPVGPAALAFMLGQEAMSLGTIQLYEYLREGARYVPSIHI